MASQRPGRYLETFLEPVASFSQSMSPFQTMTTPNVSNLIPFLVKLMRCFCKISAIFVRNVLPNTLPAFVFFYVTTPKETTLKYLNKTARTDLTNSIRTSNTYRDICFLETRIVLSSVPRDQACAVLRDQTRAVVRYQPRAVLRDQTSERNLGSIWEASGRHLGGI